MGIVVANAPWCYGDWIWAAFTALFSRIKLRERLPSIHGKSNFLLLPRKVFDSISVRGEWSGWAISSFPKFGESGYKSFSTPNWFSMSQCYTDRFYDRIVRPEFQTLLLRRSQFMSFDTLVHRHHSSKIPKAISGHSRPLVYPRTPLYINNKCILPDVSKHSWEIFFHEI